MYGLRGMSAPKEKIIFIPRNSKWLSAPPSGVMTPQSSAMMGRYENYGKAA
jgi:hypothetical protein